MKRPSFRESPITGTRNQKEKKDGYFLASKRYQKKHGYKALHREIWKSHFGEIPPGYHIHHKDHNPANNDISNLELISRREHAFIHCSDEKWKKTVTKKRAKKWGASWKKDKKKIAQMKRNTKRSVDLMPIVFFTCLFCEKQAKRRTYRKVNKFCSKKCSSQHFSRRLK